VTDVSALKEALKPQLAVVPTGRTDVPDLEPKEARRGLKLSDRAAALLRAAPTGGEDRSARLFELAALLRDAGATEDATFVLLKGSPWNKFEGRDDEVERLWEAVERSRVDTAGEREEALRSRLRVGQGEPELVSDFLDRSIDPPSWFVEGILQKGGLHFVAAPKKCYKSTFVTDLAYSLVSGSDFLNDMTVAQTASVLMIQEENPESLQQLRMRAMRRAKDVELHPDPPTIQENGDVLCDFSSVPFWQVNKSGLKLCYEEDRRTIENWIKRKQIEVVIFDPLYILAGCEILHGKDIMGILDWWLHLKFDLGVTIVVVHHMKKLPEEIPEDVSQLMFGSSYLANAYDGAVLLMPRYAQGSMVIEKVHCVRDYRAWREGAFDFSIFLEEDGSEYIVQVDQGNKHVHPLVKLVQKQPGITVAEAAVKLSIDESSVKKAATRHGLVKKRKTSEYSKQGGRPKTGYYLPQ
jgi:hypothetical protein